MNELCLGLEVSTIGKRGLPKRVVLCCPSRDRRGAALQVDGTSLFDAVLSLTHVRRDLSPSTHAAKKPETSPAKYDRLGVQHGVLMGVRLEDVPGLGTGLWEIKATGTDR